MVQCHGAMLCCNGMVQCYGEVLWSNVMVQCYGGMLWWYSDLFVLMTFEMSCYVSRCTVTCQSLDPYPHPSNTAMITSSLGKV